jgi:hypothetical protein
MNKRFVVEKYGKISHCIIRQMPHDTQYVIGSTIPRIWQGRRLW